MTATISASESFCSQFYRWQFLLELCNYVTKVTVSIAIMQLEVSATLMQVKISAAYMWVTIFIEIMPVEFLLQSCRWYFLQCIMHMTISIVIMQVAVSIVAMCATASSSSFFKKLKRHYLKFAFHHFNKYSSKIKILYEFIYKSVKRVIQSFCF